MSAAFVSADTFRRRPFDLSAFLLVVSLQLLTVSPFILATYGFSPMRPEVFAVVAHYAFLGFFLVFGILVGGLVTLVLQALRGQDA
jgi:hypothetical protein